MAVGKETPKQAAESAKALQAIEASEKRIAALVQQSVGANAAKFQHFKAETIISEKGFKEIGKKSHQSKWKKGVYQTYKDASINFSWTKKLQKECKKNKIDFMTAPYDLEYINQLNKYICAYKIGSGDITWLESIRAIASKKKTSNFSHRCFKFK